MKQLFAGILFAGLYSALFWASLQFAWPLNGEISDFTPRWVGSRMATEGINPYSERVEWQIQLYVFRGELAPPDVDPAGFAYPLHILLLLAPIWLLPLEYAFAAWGAINLLVALSLPIIVKETFRLQTSAFTLLPLIFGFVVFRQSTDTWVLGQFTLVPAFAAGVALFAATREARTLFLVALLYMAIRPEGAILVPFFLLLFTCPQWGNYVAGGFYTAFTFIVVAFLVQIFVVTGALWPYEFLSAVRRYSQYANAVWLPGQWETTLAIPIVLLVALFVINY